LILYAEPVIEKKVQCQIQVNETERAKIWKQLELCFCLLIEKATNDWEYTWTNSSVNGRVWKNVLYRGQV